MNVVGYVNRYADPRRHFVHGLEPGMRLFEWLETQRWELPASTILSASNATSPITVQRGEGTARWFGGAVRGVQANTAFYPSDESWGSGQLFPDADGECFMGFASSDDGRCCVAVDPLGIFPLYYASTPDFFLFSSSMWPFGRHPQLSSHMDPDGLIGILLTQGIVAGRTIQQGVTRLRPGHAVTWQPGRVATEHAIHQWKPTAALFAATRDQQLDALDEVLGAAVVGGETDTLLLSGGLDSRLVAGYLNDARERPVQAISLGSPWHYDVAFAREVADRLGWPHRSIEIDHHLFPQHARLQVQHEQLSSMFSDLSFWQLVADLRARAPVLATGFCGNNVLEPLRHDPGEQDLSFPRVFASCNKYGLSSDTIRDLLRVDRVEERIAAVVDALRLEYEAIDGEPFQRALLFDLTHRARFLIGAVVWRLSFGAQPVLPYADRRVIRTALTLPVSAFQGRQLQRALLCRQFPSLARLPLDTATFFTRPLLPTVGERVRHLGLLAIHGLFGRRERRYYHSVFDLNSPGWRAVRLEAEAGRARAESVLNPELLRKLVPPPHVDVQLGSRQFFHVGSRTKGLLAFMWWASEHL